MARVFTGDLSWLLDDLVTRVTEISKAVVLTRDGPGRRVFGRGLTREDAEHLSRDGSGHAEPRPGRGAALRAAAGSGRPSWRWRTPSCS